MNNNTNKSANNLECGNSAKLDQIRLKEMFVDIVEEKRIELGQKPAKRPVFLKPHGVAYGQFIVKEEIPEELKIGIFKYKDFKAWVRFSSDTTPDSSDLKSTCGIAIKLFDVKGGKLLRDSNTHDFIMQNHDVFFVDDVHEMAEFTSAGVVDKNYSNYLNAHLKTNLILKEMAKVEDSSLTATYWGVLPYAFGNRYVKYKLVPEGQAKGRDFDDINYLGIDLKNRLLKGPATFKFMIQFQSDSISMPLDKATVRWDENVSKPIHIATLILPQQDIATKGQAEYGENLFLILGVA